MAVAGGSVRRALLAGALLFVVLAASGGEARAARGFELGIVDPSFSSGNAATRALWLGRAQDAGAQSVRFRAGWRSIASETPPANPQDPADPSYDWDRLDAVVRDASARGFRVVLTIYGAPDWAEGPDRDPDAAPGTWKPDPTKLAQFSKAVATRYSGSYVDPDAGGGALPRVRDWHVWAEQNLWFHLQPQWEAGRRFAPVHYRKMLNAAYASIKGVSSSNRVATGATAPFGDEGKGALRIPPLRFWRDVLCLKGRKLKRAKKCPGGRAHLDALAHNPLSWGAEDTGPWKPAAKVAGPEDIIVPDMHELSKLLLKARTRRTIRPRRRAPLWATELLWESNPPDATGVSPTAQARYLADALYLLWRQRVKSVQWVRLHDGSGAVTRGDTKGAGLYYSDQSPKPSLTAYQFPFVPIRSKGVTRVWGIAPQSGEVEVQKLAGGDWRTVKRVKTRGSRIFKGKLSKRAKGKLRAAIGETTSLPRKPR